MAEGQCIYEGSTPLLLPYLNQYGLVCPPNHNPADYGMLYLYGIFAGNQDFF